MTSPAHPSDADLAAYVLRESEPAQVAEIEFHREMCPACEARIDRLRTLTKEIASLGRHVEASAPAAILVADADGPRFRTLPRPGVAPLTIGRGTAAGLTLRDERCSRIHCRIEPVGTGHRVADEGSANGTFVNDERIDDARPLRDGDVVRIGDATLRYLAAPAAVRDARPAPEPILQAVPVPESSASGASLRLVIEAPEGRWVYPWDGTPITVGRSSRCDVRIPDVGCSRQHLRLTWSGGTARVRDLETRNGTLLGGAPLRHEAELPDGAVLQIGRTKLTFAGAVGNATEAADLAPRLEVTVGDEILTFEIAVASAVIGRGRAATIRIDHASLSRMHCEVTQRPDGLHLRDLESRNGTLVDGQRTTAAVLAPGRTFLCGQVSITYVDPAAPAPASPVQDPTTSVTEAVVAPTRPARRRLVRVTRSAEDPTTHALRLTGMIAAVALLCTLGINVLQGLRRQGEASNRTLARSNARDAERSAEARRLATERNIQGQFTQIGEFARENPSSHTDLALLYRDFASSYPGHPLAAEALRQAGHWERQASSYQEGRYAQLERDVDEALAMQDFTRARGLLQDYLAACPGTPRFAEIQARHRRLEEVETSAYRVAQTQAQQMVAAGRLDEAEGTLRQLLARFGSAPLVAQTQEMLTAVRETRRQNEERTRLAAVETQRRQDEVRVVEQERQMQSGDTQVARAIQESLTRWTSLQEEFARSLTGGSARRVQERQALFQEILALRPQLTPALQAEILERHARLMRTLENRLASGSIRGALQDFDGTLNTRRRDALALIMDARAYPYPDQDPHKSEVQERVDALVAAVEEAYWPGMKLLESMDGLGDIQQRLGEIEGYLPYCSPQPERTRDQALQALLGDLDLAQVRAFSEQDQRILQENEKTAREISLTAEEERCIRITNEYRIRMGRRPLRIEPRLVRTARAHSQDMIEKGYFSHTGQDGSTPQARAGRQGYTQPVGENIYYGSPSGEQAFLAWQHSSGHHRNMLTPGWTEIGVGQSDTHWTMLPGGGGGR